MLLLEGLGSLVSYVTTKNNRGYRLDSYYRHCPLAHFA